MAVTLDWAGFERALTDALVQAVSTTVAEHPHERFYAAVLNRIYRETDGRITLPHLGMNSIEALAQRPVEKQADLRWSATDWEHYEELKPGRAYCDCDITVEEVDEAIRGLTSQYVIIRRHAVGVLGERSLGTAVARRVLPLLVGTVRQDADATVRRLAILSLLSWRKESRRYANVVRQALDDPVEEVRMAAGFWLREQDADRSA